MRDPHDFFKASPALYTVSADRPFLTNLSLTLLHLYKDNPLGLAEVMIFLPTRRAARALADAFVEVGLAQGQGAATLLPRIRTLGDLEEEAGYSGTGQDLMAVPPAITGLERRMVLAHFVHRRDTVMVEQKDSRPAWDRALKVADELGKLLDSFHTQQVPFDQLGSLVDDHYAAHWQQSLDFLKIVTESWPAFLHSRGCLDPAERRRLLIDRLADQWNVDKGGSPPAHPVIIAGSTGSMPAVARLMNVVARMPHGGVVLPGVDINMGAEGWAKIDDPHPQMGFKELLEVGFQGACLSHVKEWPTAVGGGQYGSARQKFLSLALLPAHATGDWQQRLVEFRQRTSIEEAIAGVHIIEAANEQAEADAIALAMREALQTPEKRVILVTPDRTLSARVCTRLGRWGIRLDDSAGIPFANTLRGVYLRLVAKWLEDPTDPVALLTLLKNPLCTVGYSAKELAPLTAKLDLALRGLRAGHDFSSLRQRLMDATQWDALTRDSDDGFEATQKQTGLQVLLPLIDRLAEIAAPFETAKDPSFATRLEAHIAAAESLAACAVKSGAEQLWSFEDGQVAAQLIAALRDQADWLKDIENTSYTDLLTTLMAGPSVRAAGQSHPRLLILGPLEARLQKADLMILGGLNEGVWPSEAETDPFLSRPMRAELGLLSPERRIGLAAHDFAQLSNAPEVTITRAKQVSRSPTKPSRWLVRIKNILKAEGQLDRVDRTQELAAWADRLDAAEGVIPAHKPQPTPPVAARPHKLYVTHIERLLRDPYSIYASHILRLRALDPLNADLDAALRGRFYHNLYAQFALNYPKKLPDNIPQLLTEQAALLADKAMLSPALRAFWMAPMAASFEWFTAFEQYARAQGKPVLIEQQGEWSFAVEGLDKPFTLAAKVDRIDQSKEGFLTIYDYKTGNLKTGEQMKIFAGQLQLTALILQNGDLGNIPNCPVERFAFLKILNRNSSIPFADAKDDKGFEGDKAREAIITQYDNLMSLLTYFAQPETPYLSQPRPQFKDEYGQYDHLARRSEWALSEEGGEE